MKAFMEKMKGLLSIRGLIGVLLLSAGLGYFLAAIDIIPDTLPVLGYVDDVIIIIAAFFIFEMLARKMGWLHKGEKK